MKALALALLLACAAPASAQTGRRRAPKREPAPLALAIDLAFSTTFWSEVQVSTMGPVSDLTDLVHQGCYKLELIQLVLMSRDGKQPLKKTVEKRKKGERLADIAADYHLRYDDLYESSLAIEEIVDKDYLPRFPEKRPRKEKERRDPWDDYYDWYGW